MKIVTPGRIPSEGFVFCKIELKPSKNPAIQALSISGVVGPLKNGDCRGSCGQIQDELLRLDFEELNDGWDYSKVMLFRSIWRTYHLNNISAGCIHQEATGWRDELFNESKSSRDQANMRMWSSQDKLGLLSVPCPICGYRYGSSWNVKPIPQWALDFLESLPESNLKPAWV